MHDVRAIRRYARVLLDLAVARGRAESVLADLGRVRDILARTPELASAMADPALPEERRGLLVGTLIAACADPLAREFVARMARRKQSAWLADLAKAYERLHRERRGAVQARVATAAPMPEGWAAQLAEALGRRLGRTVEASFAVDPSLLAGFRVRAGDRVFDCSAAARVEQLRRAWMAGS